MWSTSGLHHALPVEHKTCLHATSIGPTLTVRNCGSMLRVVVHAECAILHLVHFYMVLLYITLYLNYIILLVRVYLIHTQKLSKISVSALDY